MTPVYKILSTNSSDGEVWAKLENQNPTGSHKDRSIKRWIEYYIKEGKREFSISSSGNSAISAAKYCSENKAKLIVFVSPNISREKITKLKRYKDIILNITKTPNKDAFQFAKRGNVINLRASKDDAALKGYEDIALELVEQIPHIDNIFIPTSSGATLQGMYNGFKGNRAGSDPARLPALFAVQTTKVSPIASHFDKSFTKQDESYADAIVDNVAHRRDQVVKIINLTKGGGLVISNEKLKQAKSLLINQGGWQGQSTAGAWQSALSFAGYLKWRLQNPERPKKEISVCLFTD